MSEEPGKILTPAPSEGDTAKRVSEMLKVVPAGSLETDELLSAIILRGKVRLYTVECGGDVGQDYCTGARGDFNGTGQGFRGLIVLQHEPDPYAISRSGAQGQAEMIWWTECFTTRELALHAVQRKAKEKGLTVVSEKHMGDKMNFQQIKDLVGPQWVERMK